MRNLKKSGIELTVFEILAKTINKTAQLRESGNLSEQRHSLR